MQESLSTEKAALVALLRRKVNARRWRAVIEQVEELGSALAVLRGETAKTCPVQLDLFEEDEVRPDPTSLGAIQEEMASWERGGARFVTVLDGDYPANLRTVYDRPPFLFIRGNVLDGDQRSVAVVGTRKASPLGLARATKLACQLAKAGVTVVSGLAKGIDTAAHTAAMEAGGRTLAVIGTGIDRYYPPENKALQDSIPTCGAVLSQFWPNDPPAKFRFPMRNAVMSGLALATAVIEASETSGAKIQAEQALRHNRPVFLLKSLLEHKWARDFSTRPGVTVIDDVSQVLEKIDLGLSVSIETMLSV